MKRAILQKLYAYLRNHQFLSLASNITVAFFNVVSVALLFRVLPVHEIGMWVFFSSSVGLADSFRAGFLITALIRTCAGASVQRTKEAVGSAWVIALCITAILALLNLAVWLVYKHVPDGDMALLLRWFGIALVATLPSFMTISLAQASMRFDRILYVRLFSQGLFVFNIILLLLTKTTTLDNVVYCYVLSSVITSLFTLTLGWTDLRALRHRTKACIQEFVHFGKYNVGSYVCTSLLRSSDTLLINFVLGPTALAVYNLAGRFSEVIEIPLRSIIVATAPTLAAAFNQQRLDVVADVLRRKAGILTWLFTPVILGIILLADVPILLIGGLKYQHTEAANLLRISMAMALLYPIDRFVGVTLDVLNRPQLNLIKVLLMLFVNIAGNIVALTVSKGVYGVALVSVVTLLVGFGFEYFQLKKFLKISFLHIISSGLKETQEVINRILAKPVELTTEQNQLK